MSTSRSTSQNRSREIWCKINCFKPIETVSSLSSPSPKLISSLQWNWPHLSMFCLCISTTVHVVHPSITFLKRNWNKQVLSNNNNSMYLRITSVFESVCGSGHKLIWCLLLVLFSKTFPSKLMPERSLFGKLELTASCTQKKSRIKYFTVIMDEIVGSRIFDLCKYEYSFWQMYVYRNLFPERKWFKGWHHAPHITTSRVIEE